MKKQTLILVVLLIVSTIAHAQWTQIGSDIDGEAADDQSGCSVSLSADGSVVAIGAYTNDGNGTDAGHVRIYKNISGTWTQIGNDIDGEAAADYAGSSVSLSSDGSVVAIGADWNDGNGDRSGHVRIYENMAGVWTQIGSDIDGEAIADYSGKSVSLSADGSVVAIGAPYNDGIGIDIGHVRIYENIAGIWTQIGSDIDGEANDDRSGKSVSLSADGFVVAIGATGNDDSGFDAGHVRVYENIAGTWTKIGNDIDGGFNLDYSGWAVSLSADGSVLAIAAPWNNGNGADAGHVRVFEDIAGTWTQIGSDIEGEASGDESGRSVSISADGSIVAIGAYQNDGNGADAGHVRIYKNIAGTWTQIGNDIDGETADDKSGGSVGLCSNGYTVTIGAIGNDGSASWAGHVRVYTCNTYATINPIDCDTFISPSGKSWITSGTYLDTIPNAMGCDSIISINLTVNYSNFGVDSQTACDSLLWIDGNTYYANNNTATHTLTNVAGCDSLVTLDLTVNYFNTGIDTQTACDSLVWIDGNTYYATNNVATHTLTNVAGCDSVVTLDLTINSNTGIDTQTTCDSLVWIDGNTYYANNNLATHTLTNAAGCDSVVTLDLTVNYSNTGTDVQTACDSLVWIDGNTYYATNNSATHILTNVAGCDSLVTLNLIVNYSNTGIDTQTACDSLVWIDGNTYYANNNVATHTLTNVAGCDSVVTLDLTVNYSNTGIDTQTACDSLVWIDGNTYYATNNSATHTFTNVAGCDSVVTLDLTVNYSNTGIDTQTACFYYLWIDGNTYYVNNNSATHTLMNAAGCDSVVTLDLTINTVDVSVSICMTINGFDLIANQSGASYQWVDCANSYAIIAGETNQSFTPTVNGDYAVIIDDGTCVDTSLCYLVIGVGISERIENLVQVYPNPTTGKITIQCKDMQRVEVLDIAGKLVYELPVSSNMLEIDISTFSKGVYFVKVSSQDGISVERIVLE